MSTGYSTLACSSCHGKGNAENWNLIDRRYSVQTNFNDLRRNAADCVLCASIWHSIQMFPRGREMIRESRPLNLYLGYWSKETFRVRYDLTPPGPSQIEYQFDIIVSRENDSTSSNLGIFQTEGCREAYAHGIRELSAIPMRSAISPSPICEDTLASLMLRISECNTEHEHSRGLNCAISLMTIPDRLVDVGPADGSAEPRLLDETSHVKGPYLALSHCWGGTMPFRTLKSNKTELCQRIEFSRLPRNMQDAVIVTRWLGFRYIWIDSFCIVQDDSQDWLEQASQMASIYAAAFLTICATRSTSFNEGFLWDRRSDIKLPLADRLPVGMALYARDCNKLEDGHNNITGAIPSPGAPLFGRAWCFQERLLSQRVLHFMDTELVLECEEELLCECNEQDSYESPPEKQVYSKEPDGTPKVSWETLVEQYTSRQLTYSLDVFPAISAIARDYDIENYIAGLNGDDEKGFLSNLLWKVMVRQSTDGHLTMPSRPDRYTAPSFSWASVIAPVVYAHPIGAGFEFICEREDSSIMLRNPDDPFGRIKDGWLILWGLTVEATMRSRPEMRGDQQKGYELKAEIFRENRKILANMDTEDDPPPGTPLTCVTMCIETTWYNRHNGLVLKQSQERPGTYERVGCYWDANEGFFKDSVTELLSIT